MQNLLVAVQWLLLLLLAGALAALLSLPWRRRGHRDARTAAVVEPPDDDGEKPEWWRCNVCGLRWRSRGATHVSTLGLRVRRSARRRARAAGRSAPEWAAARGTQRCPSCLSRSIRPSRQQR
jgi:hypothetical protein